MRRYTHSSAPFAILVMLLVPSVVWAQHHHHPTPQDTTSQPTTEHRHGQAHETMRGMYGPYPLSREASGTSWQPQTARHEGVHISKGAWMLMLHGFVDLVYDDQDGPRGDTDFFSGNMAMATARRALGRGNFGLRAMLSLEPGTIGKEGYPLLLQTGETADGVTHLIDRQHPHDLFMELAATYSISSGERSLFLYAGLPGEPALGPPAFMHRFSGVNIPVAPITHHWLDSTHITYGVLTAGGVFNMVKVEGSAFRGREPDQDRWDIESPELDSYSFRLSVNPSERIATQVSFGSIESPEQLEPELDQDRITASVMVDGTLGIDGHWESSIAWGQNRNDPGPTLDAFLIEGALEMAKRHTIFARAEYAEKNELLEEPDPRAEQVFDVGELTVGYRYDFLRGEHAALGVGGAGTLSFVPDEIEPDYGNTPLSGILFLHAALR